MSPRTSGAIKNRRSGNVAASGEGQQRMPVGMPSASMMSNANYDGLRPRNSRRSSVAGQRNNASRQQRRDNRAAEDAGRYPGQQQQGLKPPSNLAGSSRVGRPAGQHPGAAHPSSSRRWRGSPDVQRSNKRRPSGGLFEQRQEDRHNEVLAT